MNGLESENSLISVTAERTESFQPWKYPQHE
jgi:hypothetical protein